MPERDFDIAVAAVNHIGYSPTENPTPNGWPCVECTYNVLVPFIEYKNGHRQIRRRKDCARQHGMGYIQNKVRNGEESSCVDFKHIDSEDLDIYPL